MLRKSALLLLLAVFAVGALACASNPTWDEPKGARSPAEEPVEPGVKADPDEPDEEGAEEPPAVPLRPVS